MGEKGDPSRGDGPQDAPGQARGREVRDKLEKGIKNAEKVRAQHGPQLDKLLEERGLTHDDLGAVMAAAASPGSVAVIPTEIEDLLRDAVALTGLEARTGDTDA